MRKRALTLLSFFILLILTFPTIAPLLRNGFYYSHDGIVHTARFVKFSQAINDGQFPPRWASGLAFGNGTPAIMFYGFLPNLAALIPLSFTNSYSDSVEIIFALASFLSSITFFLYAKNLTKSNLAAITGAILYVWAPYRMVDTYVRGAFPESFIFIFPPLLFLSIPLLQRKNRFWGILLATFSIVALILSHTILALGFIGLFLSYTLLIGVTKKTIRIFMLAIFTLVLGLLISAFFWIPAVFESKQIHSEVLDQLQIYKTNFISPLKLIYSRWGWGIINSNNSIATHIGIPHLLSFILVITGLIIRKISHKNTILLFFTTSTIFLMFLTTKFSAPLWDNIHLLQLFVYPWRFLAIICFTTSSLVAVLITKLPHKTLATSIFIGLMILSGRNSLQFASYYSSDNLIYSNFEGTTDIAGEFLPKNANIRVINKCYVEKCEFPKIQGLTKNQFDVVTDKSNELTFTYQSINPSLITINTFDYPGWNLYLDGSLANKQVNNLGTISFNAPRGSHYVNLKFEDTGTRKMSNLISLYTIIVILIFSVIKLYFLAKSYLLVLLRNQQKVSTLRS